jgi:hypothetical protein
VIDINWEIGQTFNFFKRGTVGRRETELNLSVDADGS